MPYIGNKPTNVPLSSADLADNIVTSAKIADDAVDSDQLASGAVDNAHLATGIASSKLSGALPALDASSLTSIPAGNLTGTVADARISTLTSSKLSGALPAISGASLTNLDARDLENALPAISGASLTGLSSGAFKQIVEVSATTWGATTSTSYVDIAGISASITTTGGNSTVMVQIYTGGAVSHPGVRGFAAIQNYTASSSTQFEESAIVIGDNDSGSPAQASFSNGCITHTFTGLAAQTWNFRGRWRQHAPNGSFNNSRAQGTIILWELA